MKTEIINRLLEIKKQEEALTTEKSHLRAKLHKYMNDNELKTISGKNYSVTITDATTKWSFKAPAQIIEQIREAGDPDDLLTKRDVPERMIVRKRKSKKKKVD